MDVSNLLNHPAIASGCERGQEAFANRYKHRKNTRSNRVRLVRAVRHLSITDELNHLHGYLGPAFGNGTCPCVSCSPELLYDLTAADIVDAIDRLFPEWATP